jgi:GAF domain-containing protein
MASSDSYVDLERLANALAAQQRLAMLVAREAPAEEIFRAVTEEAARVLGTAAVGMLRFEPDDVATFVASSDAPWTPPPLGTQLALDGDNVVTEVYRTAEAARADDWTDATGTVTAMATVLGVRSCVATPILVEGHVWGTLIAATNENDPLPPHTESRIREFTEIVATALANAQARSQLSHLADVQAALRRVATLAAETPDSEALFSAVAREVADVLDVRGVCVSRFNEDNTQTVVGGAYDEALPNAEAIIGVGTRVALEPGTLAAAVLDTRRGARVQDYAKLTGKTGSLMRAAGFGSGCAAPIIVDGRAWGQMCAFAAPGTLLPPGLERQLHDFVGLVATAISNYDARARLRLVADEQAALRRVATLVARGGSPEGVFGAVADQVDVLFGGDVSAIVRFEADGTATVLGDTGGPYNAGRVVTLDEGYVVHTVRETGRSARFDTDDPSSAGESSLVRTLGVRSAVASPIVVEGQVWGAITAASVHRQLAPTAEQRLTEFTELVATAVANTQARHELTTLAREQAALRRVATLVAEGVPAADVFSAVSGEVARLFGTTAAVGRFDPEEPAVATVGTADRTPRHVAIGSRFELGDERVATLVRRTGRSARVGRSAAAPGTADFLGPVDRASSVASPIVVDGRL